MKQDGTISRAHMGTGVFASREAAENYAVRKLEQKVPRPVRVTSDDGYDRCEWIDFSKFDHEKDPVLTTAETEEQWIQTVAKIMAEKSERKRAKTMEIAKKIAVAWKYDTGPYANEDPRPKPSRRRAR